MVVLARYVLSRATPQLGSARQHAPRCYQMSMSRRRLASGVEVPVAEDGETSALDNLFAGGPNISSFQDLMRMLGGGSAMSKLEAVDGGGSATFADPKTFRKDVARLKARFRDEGRGLLNPRDKKVQYWDLITGMALLFTMFVTPFEVRSVVPAGGYWWLFRSCWRLVGRWRGCEGWPFS